MNIVAIIQARMGSSRLPGKVLMDINGKTMLERVYERVQLSRHVNKIVVAAPDHLRDEPIWQLCKKKGWASTFRDENDVLGRYWAAATHYRADKVVRITADCPLVDPEIIDRVIATSTANATLDYVCNFYPVRTYPRGLDIEVISMKTLEHVYRNATSERHREHVSLMIYENAKQFQISSVSEGRKQNYSHLRWTVDTYQDLQLANEIYSHFENRPFGWRDIVEAYETNPHWIEINREVIQKTA